MRDEMVKKIEKWQEPPPAKIEKPLPVPDQEPKKRRGGRRLRKMKERYGMTDVRKLQNRINFNQVCTRHDIDKAFDSGWQSCSVYIIF